ncbi:hypothetical protein T03_10201 [Trichinella britovi]|uniref:Uncharacterized protein n=1 Tax=Trichinella britovi TaxID=45882 RepID=A0A0V0YZA8_TRIBR|nr:hypothetical protein T03_10201 [Trichinella britovi]
MNDFGRKLLKMNDFGRKLLKTNDRTILAENSLK